MEGFESGRFELTARHRRVVARLPFGEELIRVDCHTICAKTLDPVTGATLMVEEEVISEGVKDLLVKGLGLIYRVLARNRARSSACCRAFEGKAR